MVYRQKSCGAVVYKMKNNEPLFLIEHMRKGHISIPKGRVERNETEEETAIREIREETNLEVNLDTGFRETITYSPRKNVIKDVIFFIAEARSGEMRNQESEVIKLEWLPLDQALEIITFDQDKEVLRHAKEYIQQYNN